MSARELVRVRRRFAGRPDHIAEARRLVSRVVGKDSPAYETARLLVSEAATNALLHSASGERGGSLEVECQLEDGRNLRVEVRDQGSASKPRPRAHARDALSGRGLEVLDALAKRWGSSGSPEGHTVWFELEVA
jgi:anti-sigma regulatory factor (Ser/Thr protein kinase)